MGIPLKNNQEATVDLQCGNIRGGLLLVRTVSGEPVVKILHSLVNLQIPPGWPCPCLFFGLFPNPKNALKNAWKWPVVKNQLLSYLSPTTK